MSTRRSLAYAAGGLGAAALAAVATGVVVERRVVKARRAGAAQADRLGVLHSDPVEVICDDGLVLHAEVDEVVVFGPGSHGEPTATDWARWCGTIDYEIDSRMGGRQTRVWVGEEEQE